MITGAMGTDESVRKRYAAAASAVEPALCCAASDYDPTLLKAIPQAVLDIDYGCGNPSKWIAPGETVLDLGSGSGKICYLAAQVVGAKGKVIGVDFNPPMLELSRREKAQFVKNVGFDNVSFRHGRIQDLALDLDVLGDWLAKHPVSSPADYLEMQSHADQLRVNEPLIQDDSIDVIVSNCVLNLVSQAEREALFSEMFRVLKRGGRCVISDIVSDEVAPRHMQDDPDLWSGCISGAFVESEFLDAFGRAGFYGMEIVARADDPWRVVEGIEFRSVTVAAYKGKEGPCFDRNQAVIYRGPFQSVTDDDGHTLQRGEPTAVCDKTFGIFTRPPYADHVFAVLPVEEVPLNEAQPFDCSRIVRRDPRETKVGTYNATTNPADCCGDTGCC